MSEFELWIYRGLIAGAFMLIAWLINYIFGSTQKKISSLGTDLKIGLTELTTEVKNFAAKHASYEEKFKYINQRFDQLDEEFREQKIDIKSAQEELIRLRTEHDSINCLSRNNSI